MSAHIEDVKCSITLSNLLDESNPATSLPIPNVTPAAWALIEDFIKESLVLETGLPPETLLEIIVLPEYYFEKSSIYRATSFYRKNSTSLITGFCSLAQRCQFSRYAIYLCKSAHLL